MPSKKEATISAPSLAPEIPVVTVESVTSEQIVMEDTDEFPAEEGEAMTESPAVETNSPPTAPAAPAGPAAITPEELARRRKNKEATGLPRGRPPGKKGSPARLAPVFDDVKKAAGETPAAPAAPSAPAAPTAPTAPPVDYRALSEMAFGIGCGVLCQVFGPEWAPGSDQERLSIVLPLEAYMKAKQMPDLPPGVIVLIACASYAGGRFRAPNTRTKIAGAWGWLKSKLARRRPVEPIVNHSARAA